METQELLQWLGTQTDSQITSPDDIKISRQVCFFLIQLTGKPQIAAKVSLGKTPFERSANFQLAKTLFGSELNLPFTYSIAKLVEGETQEITELLKQLKSLTNDGNMELESSLDSLLDDLQDDLVNRMREAKAYREQLDLIAEERNFYMDKLQRIVKATRSFDPVDAESILHIVQTPPTDFLPPK